VGIYPRTIRTINKANRALNMLVKGTRQSPCGFLATTIILLVGARQFELWMLILTLTLSKEVEIDWSFYVLVFGHYVTFTYPWCAVLRLQELYWSETWFVRLLTKYRLFRRRKEGAIYKLHHPHPPLEMYKAHIFMREHLI
jgi:hypothetical protein